MATTRPIRRKRYTAAQRDDYLTRFGRDGVSAAEFCAEHNINVSTLYQWIRRAKPTRSDSSPLFQEVSLSVPPLLSVWMAEIVVGQEFLLRLGAQASPEFIAQVIHQLRRPC